MVLDKFTYMNRQTDDTEALTRLLINGKIEGDSKIVKLNGYANSITGREIMGGGHIQFDRVFKFKDPRHEYAQNETFFAVWSNNLYWWNGVNWMKIDIDGEQANFDDTRIWFERGELHVSGGAEGKSSVYKYMDRDAGAGKGYFENVFGFNGFWFGKEELPDFDGDDITITAIDAVHNSGNYSSALQKNVDHYLLGVFVTEGGQIAIPKKEGMKRFSDNTCTNSFTARIKIAINPDDLDKRVTAIDLYGAVEAETIKQADREVNLPGNFKVTIPGRTMKVLVGDLEFEEITWRLLRRIDINKPCVLFTGVGYCDSDLDVLEVAAQDGSMGHFVNDSLNTYFYLEYKLPTENDYKRIQIDDVSWDSGGPTTGISVISDVFTASTTYDIRVVGIWQLNSGNYEIYALWRFTGEGDTETELGDPITTINPYGLTDEYYVNSQFQANQNRRVWKLDVTTDKRYRNILIWSEIDRPAVCPNGNMMIFNTSPGEESRGLKAVYGGLLALYEKSVHLVRLDGDPVRYDTEENKWDKGCIAPNSVVNKDGIPFWLGIEDINFFESYPQSLIEDILRDDYLTLIANEYSNNNNSYEAIVGGYSRKQNLIIWSFPNSDMTIGDLTVQLLAYHVGKGFLFLESDKTFTWFFEGYNGELYGIDEDGVYELFADTPSESNRMVWEGGILTPEMGEVMVERLRLVYKGTPTVKLYADRSSTAVFNETLSNKTSLGQESRFVNALGREMQIHIESPSSTDGQEFNKVGIKEHQLELT